MPAYQLAQLNIAHLKAPMDSPLLADFVANLDRINALAEEAPGFVWRLQTEDGDATSLRPFDEMTIVNMSVWESAEALYDYVYNSAHVEIMKQRKKWFHFMKEAYVVLWWVPAGHEPSMEEAKVKLMLLREQGPTPEAFTMKKSFPAPYTVSPDV